MAQSAPGPRLILLTGAPAATSLSWDEADLSTAVLPAFTESHATAKNKPSTHLPSSCTGPQWRALPLSPQQLRTGETQPTPRMELLGISMAEDDDLSFLTESSFANESTHSAAETRNDIPASSPRNNFLEHSLVLHDELLSSQILFASGSEHGSASADGSFVSSNSTATASASIPSPSFRPIPHVPYVPLTRLSSLPSASTIDALQPQTLTINLLAGIISVPEAPRQVIPRRWRTEQSQRSLDLQEIAVGDASRSGFTVSLWLGLTPATTTAASRPPVVSAAEAALRTTALSLQKGDLVLFRNLALASWRQRVYGQSLRRGLTSLQLLHRAGGDEGGVFSAEHVERAESHVRADKKEAKEENEELGKQEHSMLYAVAQLRQWMREFVPLSLPLDHTGSVAAAASRQRQGASRHPRAQQHRELPPDTPVESVQGTEVDCL
jgi:hypothetical protein